MNKSLGTVAGIGFGLAILFFILAGFLSPETFRAMHLNMGENPALSKPGSRQWAWDGGDEINISMPSKVTLIPGGTPTVIVRGPEDVLQHVELNHGTLHGYYGDDCFIGIFCDRHAGRLDVELHGIALNEINISGVADVDLGHLDQDRLAMTVSGAGNVKGNGRLGRLDLHISGAANAELPEMAVGDVRISLSGAGNADVAPSGDADVTISGVGHVRLETKPRSLSTHISGIGNVSGPGINRNRHDNDDDHAHDMRTPPTPPAPPVTERQIREQTREQIRAETRRIKEQARQQVDQINRQARLEAQQIEASVKEKVKDKLKKEGLTP